MTASSDLRVLLGTSAVLNERSSELTNTGTSVLHTFKPSHYPPRVPSPNRGSCCALLEGANSSSFSYALLSNILHTALPCFRENPEQLFSTIH